MILDKTRLPRKMPLQVRLDVLLLKVYLWYWDNSPQFSPHGANCPRIFRPKVDLPLGQLAPRLIRLTDISPQFHFRP